MTAEMALRLGAAAGRYFRRDGSAAHRVVIGKDTRLSGYMLENALTAGLTSTGMNVLLLGPVPTPAVGYPDPVDAGRSGGDDLGQPQPAPGQRDQVLRPRRVQAVGRRRGRDRGDGRRRDDARQAREHRPRQADRGWARAAIRNSSRPPFRTGLRLDGLKVVIDCANGAAYKAAPEVLWELGAEVIPVGVTPNGTNINDRCGSTHTETAAEAVVAHGAHVGISLDGDADRVMILDETGRVADGDQIMALLAARWADEGRLHGGALVATVMSNLGLERFLQGRGLRLERTAVGDRYVVEAMRDGGFNLGGEQSGHIVMTDYATTGDGLIAGLQFLAEMVRTGRPASELTRQFRDRAAAAEERPLQRRRAAAGGRGGAGGDRGPARRGSPGKGRILIRKSGTEPLIRVMAECEDEGLLADVVDGIVEAVQAALQRDGAGPSA